MVFPSVIYPKCCDITAIFTVLIGGSVKRHRLPIPFTKIISFIYPEDHLS